jgi:transposase
MEQSITRTIGWDVGDRYTHYVVLDEISGERLEDGRFSTTPSGVEAFFAVRSASRARIVLEAGTHSRWMDALVRRLGHDPRVVDPRRLRLISQNTRKSDLRDADLLARVGRADMDLLCPVHHRREETHADLVFLRARHSLVEARSALICAVRVHVKVAGARIASCDARYFSRKARPVIPSALEPALLPMLDTIQELTDRIRAMDRKIDELCAKQYPETQILRQVHGVGPLVSLAYVLTLESPDRFRRSRDVGPFLGLVPRRDQSGDQDRQLGITKTGDKFLRWLLVQASHKLLGHQAPDCDLRQRGLEIAERGGRNAKKRAAVATARRLSVLLHALWKTGEVYVPLLRRETAKQGAAA